MRKSILLLVFVLTLSLTELCFAKLVPEPWCFKCPAGTVLTFSPPDRYYCEVPGTNQSASVPLWAKPSWAKVVWDVQQGRCVGNYIRAGDFCYRCPIGYEFTIAVTKYGTSKSYTNLSGKWNSSISNTYVITQTGNSFSWTVVGHKEVAKGTINGREVSAKWGDGPGKWLGSATGTIETVDDQGRGTKIVWSNGVVFTRVTNQDDN